MQCWCIIDALMCLLIGFVAVSLCCCYLHAGFAYLCAFNCSKSKGNEGILGSEEAYMPWMGSTCVTKESLYHMLQEQYSRGIPWYSCRDHILPHSVSMWYEWLCNLETQEIFANTCCCLELLIKHQMYFCLCQSWHVTKLGAQSFVIHSAHVVFPCVGGGCRVHAAILQS